MRFRFGCWAGLALAVVGTACVSIPGEVRANFAEAEPHENSYFRTRSDAPSPRGFISDAEREAAAQSNANADAGSNANANTDAGSTPTPTPTPTPTSTSTPTPTLEGGAP